MTVRTAGDGAAPSITTVQRIVASRFGVRVTDLKSDRRDQPLVRARHAAMYLCREHTSHSLPVIGRHFGKRDHTSVMYAIRQTEDRIGRSIEVKRALAELGAEVSAAMDGAREKMIPGPLSAEERGQALTALTALLKRREALLAELELVDARIDEIGQSTFGPTPPAATEE